MGVRFGGEFPGRSKIYQLDLLSGRIVEDVFVFQVSMIDILQGEIVDHVDQLSDDVSAVSGRKSSVFVDVVEEILVSRVVLHDEVPGKSFIFSVDLL